MKLVSKFAVGVPTVSINALLNYFWKIMGTYFYKPEMLLFSILIFLIFIYLQAVDTWGRSFLGKIQYTLEQTTSKFLVHNTSIENNSWEFKQAYTAVCAIQGRRNQMEDRFVVNNDIGNTGVSLFAVFDGHGGKFAANYARDKLIQSISKKVVKLKNITSGKVIKTQFENKNLIDAEIGNNKNSTIDSNLSERRKSLRKSSLSSDDYTKINIGVTDPEILDKIDSLSKTITNQVRASRIESITNTPKVDILTYLDGNKINYGRLLTDQILEIDKKLINTAKKNRNVAGTTALIVLIEGNKLVVANVGDSRAVMCDGKGNAIPLSFDHKPQQQREKNRIYKAGGFISLNGVWRVGGILATSRALGDYPLKDRKLVIAEPDILTFDLDDHNPMFIVLASDGLWDSFSNEEAVAFIKEHINEPRFGANSITYESYKRGSSDNITVIVINFRDRNYNISEKNETL